MNTSDSDTGNAFDPILVTKEGIIIVDIPVFVNVLSAILLKLLFILKIISFIFVVPLNAYCPMVVRPRGMVMDVEVAAALLNTCCPMLVTPYGIGLNNVES